MKFQYLSAESRLVKLIVEKVPRNNRGEFFFDLINIIRDQPDEFYQVYLDEYPNGKLKHCANFYARKIIDLEAKFKRENLFDSEIRAISKIYYRRRL